jgi:hypothetical protein
MALPPYCPSCRSIRQPNSSFCHMCGYSYVTKEPPATTLQPAPAAPPSPRLTAGDGFRFGLGFIVAVFIASLIGFVVWVVLVAAFLGTLFGGLH